MSILCLGNQQGSAPTVGISKILPRVAGGEMELCCIAEWQSLSLIWPSLAVGGVYADKLDKKMRGLMSRSTSDMSECSRSCKPEAILFARLTSTLSSNEDK